MTSLLALHGAVAAAALVAGRRLGRRTFLLCLLAPVATLGWLVAVGGDVLDGQPVRESVGWVDQLDLTLDLRLDAFSMLFVLLIAGVGALVFAYSHAYFTHGHDLGRLAATLTAFAGSMLGLVLAEDLLAIYLFWELTSVTSYLLIGHDDGNGAARGAALRALLTTGAGGLAMLGGFVLIGQAAGTYSLPAILEDPPGGFGVGVGLVLVLLGAFTKSAQWPFHAWLPGAMAAPTPVSTYLHSATMVKAGVYLVARFAPFAAAAYGWWRPTVVGVGVVTMIVGGWLALRQNDLKLLLAQSTVSQLGFMVALFGVGHPGAAAAGAAVVLAHGLFKATLFLTVGAIDHQAHTRDIRRLSGLGRRLPVLLAVAAAATLSMVGLPPLFGFVAKEGAFAALLDEAAPWAVAGIVAGSALTAAYGARLLHGAFATKQPHGVRDLVGADVEPPRGALRAAPALLAAGGVVLGFVPVLADRVTTATTEVLHGHAPEEHLALWHGFEPALLLSAVAVVGGLLLHGAREDLDRRRRAVDRHGVYESALRLLNRLADRSTGIVQNGSLPIYIAVILTTALVLPGSALLGADLPTGVDLAESPLQAFVGAAVLVAAVTAAVTRRRFVAVVLLGAVGFGVAVLFVVHGAPDLALTQLLVETLAIVVFALVLRHLPERFEPRSSPTATRLRILVAGSVGLGVTLFALLAAGARVAPPVSEAHLELAEPEGGGRNVVNVILTDFRGLDTVGEITVLAVAGMGIASLVRSRREPDEATDPSGAAPEHAEVADGR